LETLVRKVGEEEIASGPSEPLPTETQGALEDQEGLEKEIDQTIDSLFVEKGSGKAGQGGATGPGSGEPGDAGGVELETLVRKVGEEEIASGPSEPLPTESDGPLRNLENLETHLLSLEWEISPGIIEEIVSELGFLKEVYRSDRGIFRVVDLMSKVAHSLADDEGNITAQNLRFLLEAKDGIKLLSAELKGKEDYKNLVLSGVLARYQLMQGQRRRKAKERGGSGGDRYFDNLTEDLRNLSQKLQIEVRQLGSLTRKLQGRRDDSAPSETVGTVLVETSGRVFAIERDIVIRCLRVPHDMVRTVWRDREIRIRGVRSPLVNLFRLLRLKGRVKAGNKTVVVIRKGDGTLAVLVDRLLQTRAIPLKRIRDEKRLAYVRGVVPVGPDRNVYFLDTDRMVAESNR
jgi:hypothetical protein